MLMSSSSCRLYDKFEQYCNPVTDGERDTNRPDSRTVSGDSAIVRLACTLIRPRRNGTLSTLICDGTGLGKITTAKSTAKFRNAA